MLLKGVSELPLDHGGRDICKVNPGLQFWWLSAAVFLGILRRPRLAGRTPDGVDHAPRKTRTGISSRQKDSEFRPNGDDGEDFE
jgi:hypothetical protein